MVLIYSEISKTFNSRTTSQMRFQKKTTTTTNCGTRPSVRLLSKWIPQRLLSLNFSKIPEQILKFALELGYIFIFEKNLEKKSYLIRSDSNTGSPKSISPI